jgi:tetratricopeptide (TPR) repeat protein
MRLPLLQTLLHGPERRISERANRLLERGKTDQAVEVLRHGLAKLPDSIDLHVALARLLLLGDRFPEGVEEVETLLRRTPEAEPEVRRLVEACTVQKLPTAPLHHALALHHVQRREFLDAVAELERTDTATRTEFAREELSRFLDARDQPSRSAAAIDAGIYIALAREVAGEDSAALEMYRDLLHLDPELFAVLQGRLEGLAVRAAADGNLRLALVSLFLTHADEDTAARQARDLLERHPDTASVLSIRLGERHAVNPEESELLLVLARARWHEGQVQEALDLLAPLAARGRALGQLEPLLSRWRLDRSDLPRCGVLLADVLCHEGKAEQALHAIAEVVLRCSAIRTNPRATCSWPGCTRRQGRSRSACRLSISICNAHRNSAPRPFRFSGPCSNSIRPIAPCT